MTKSIILGVGAGIAAYKAVSLVRLWVHRGDSVHVMPTPRSLNFVGRSTWEAVSGHRAYTDPFEDSAHVVHVERAREADALVIAPATADLISDLASGSASHLLGATALSCSCPIIVCPAMHSHMYTHPATKKNLQKLRRYSYHVMEPAYGALTSGDEGIGRLAEPQEIVDFVDYYLSCDTTLRGRRVVISAGGTQEPIDDVRAITNASSGKQGVALARAALMMGADVTLVAAHIDGAVRQRIPLQIDVIEAATAQMMQQAMLEQADNADVIIMAAAVADFRPVHRWTRKWKKTQGIPTIELEETDDILSMLLSRARPEQVIVGFAAETGTPEEVETFARDKHERKGVDLLVVNNVSGGRIFGADDSEVLILNKDGNAQRSSGSKDEISHTILQTIVPMLK